VHTPEPVDVTQPREVEADHFAEERRILDEALERVVRRRGVRGRALVPTGAVELVVVLHARHGSAARLIRTRW
jgi:hypothetical protein